MKRTVRTNISTLTGTSFLDEVLERIVSHPLCESGALHRLAIVLPSHRAKSKLRKALVDKIEGPVRLPRFFALSGFVESSSPWTAADPLEILARFYLLVHEEQPDMTFDRFVSWATVVLNDFAAVDHELAEVNHVFQNLADIQGIEDWSFGEAPWSEDQKPLNDNGVVSPSCTKSSMKSLSEMASPHEPDSPESWLNRGQA